MRIGFGKTEACRETKEGGGLALAKPKLAEKRRRGGGLASAKPKLTEKRRREEGWLWQNRSLQRNERGMRDGFGETEAY